jgi:hypothetical protein
MTIKRDLSKHYIHHGILGVGTGGGSGTGLLGQTGPTGPTGPQGITGVYGNTGVQGTTGPTGIYGQTGVYGNTGIQGVTGTFGVTGATGPSGIVGEITADDVTYDGGYDTVGDALDFLLYVDPEVTLIGGSVAEIGSTVSGVDLSWTCNKTMESRLLSAPVPVEDRDRGPGQDGSYTHAGANLTTDTTYTITVDDGTNEDIGSTSVLFYNRRYYGVSTDAGPLDNSEVLALSTEFAYARANTHSYDCSGGKYIWICYPADLGTATFYVGGLEVTFQLTVQDVTNGSSYVESYNCYRSEELQTGSDISVVVS